MANNLTTIYRCANCDAQFPRWQGRCTECGAWGTIRERVVTKTQKHKNGEGVSAEKTINLNEIESTADQRLKTHNHEFDRVLGGGIVSGSLILLGGDPGVGKSTLILQAAHNIKNLLYISGEESARQIKIRAERINLDLNNLQFLAETDIEKIVATIKETKPQLAVIDSIQTMNFNEIGGGFGSMSQITACTGQLLLVAKEINIPIIIIGHVTKDGLVAGPKSLEHLVDVVLYLENDNKNYYKILRGIKNRFGSTGEIGIFEMTASGLKEVNNPSEIFFEKNNLALPGTISTVVMEGSRPFLVEVQALVSKTSFGYPQRRATGFDLNRLQMIVAVISKIAKFNLANYDIYLNIAGGLKIKETGVDLAVALALVSAYLEVPANKILAFGEIGLSGEIRPIPQTETRLREANKLNFANVIMPETKNLNVELKSKNIVIVNNIGQAIKAINTQK